MRVLVIGATGYVGSRLVPEMLERGHDVVAAGRDEEAVAAFAWAGDVDFAYVDVSDTVSVHLAVRDRIDAVVYLVHSMASREFVALDRDAAHSVAAACEYAGVRRLVYLSGLVPPGDLSDHLRSRLEVEEVFLTSDVPTVALRAAMVVGAGSTSFELMRRLTERLPFTPLPGWMRSSIQPVAVEDVVHVLAEALEGEPRNRHYDLGGDEVLSYSDLLAVFAEMVGLQRPQVVVPLVPNRVVGELVAAISGIPRNTVTALVDSLSYDMVCTEDAVRRDLAAGHEFMPLREALSRSLAGQTEATAADGDVQGEAETDPTWVGGVVQRTGQGLRWAPHGLVQGMLLGLRRPDASA